MKMKVPDTDLGGKHLLRETHSEILLFIARAHQMLEGIVDNMKHDFLSMAISVPVVRSEM